MADTAVGFLLESLTQLLRDYAERIGDAKNQVVGLQRELRLLKAFSMDITKKPIDSFTLEALVQNIRDVVDKAEDAIDKFVVQNAIFKERNFFGKSIHAVDHSTAISNLAEEVQAVRRDVKDIYEQKEFANQDQQHQDRGASKPQDPVVEEENVVGFDEQAKTVIDHLTREYQDLDIITIIGMPGLGKTTLARKIYNDSTTVSQFNTRARVFISENYNKEKVLLSIFKDFKVTTDEGEISNANIDSKLKEYLKERKYLIVLDDVNTTEIWYDLKNSFPNGRKGSRILITSRRKEVAVCANPTKNPHNLKFLTPDESWELLKKIIFDKEECPDELQKLGERIAAYCKGLPIAIEAIARSLKEKLERRHWEDVFRDVNSFLHKDKLFMGVLALSYYNLPQNLKSCFLYLGFFPEGHSIPVWKLICLWIAEGFIEQQETRSLEDIAEDCVEEFANMNLLIITRKRSDGRFKTFRVHNLLYDFCKKEARRQNFYQEIKRSDDQVAFDEHRRVCLHPEVMGYISARSSGKRVRSFVSFGPDEITLPGEHISAIPKAFKLLRVLDIICITFDIFPKELLQLVLLRYIAISCNIKAFPGSISKLRNMQTIILITNYQTLELAKGMWKMYQLRHLRTNASASLPQPPSKITKSLGNMQSLTTISPESCTEQVFARFPKLKKLGIRGNLVGVLDNLFDKIEKLESLTNLKLFNDVISLTSSQGQVRQRISEHKFPKELKKLTLSRTLLDWEHMQILGTIENLEVLKLKDNAFKGNVWEPRDVCFRSLRHLHIGKTNLVTWTASKLHFPILNRLVLQYCEKLEEIPIGLADVASFQVLELYYTTDRAAASAREIQRKITTQPKEAQNTTIRAPLNLYIYPPEI